MLRKCIVSLVVLVLYLGGGIAFAQDPGYAISVQFENDFFGGGTDRHFTHGTRIVGLTKPIKWITDAAEKIPWFSTESAKASDNQKDDLKARASLSIGQNIFTPNDTTLTQLVTTDRPYGGWLYVGFGLVADQGNNRYDKLQLDVGVVGPWSQSREVQTYWHSMFGLYVPKGWDNQLHNEPGAVLYYEQARRFEKQDLFLGLGVDVIPHFGGAIGNVFTYAAAGFTLRLGPELDQDFGPPRIRPSLPGSGCFRHDRAFNWYLFAGVEGRVVLRNIFLDGNTFTDSHSVDKKTLVGDLQAGLAMQLYRFRLSYTQIFRTREFKGQETPDIFGSLSLSYQF